MIPMCDLKAQYLALKPEIDAAMQSVAAGTRYILGPEVAAVERELAAYCDCQFAAGVGNGTDALQLALRALRIGPGDEVITTPFTFVATTEAIGMVGASPVFVDIEPDTFNIDPARVEAAITPRTRAILPVHLYGHPANMDALMEIAGRRNLRVVEDCAQAIGATWRGKKVGSFGDLGCLSFFPSKNLGCFGDGGMVVSNDAELLGRVEFLRRHGGRVKYHHAELGLNSRLDELQAAILRVKFPHLDAWSASRRRSALKYNARLGGELLGGQLLGGGLPHVRRPVEAFPDGPRVPTPGADDVNQLTRVVYHQYTVRVERRDAVAKRLAERGVSTMVYYPVPLHLQEVHAALGHGPGSFPRAEAAAASCLSLPMFPELTGEQQETVASALAEALRETRD